MDPAGKRDFPDPARVASGAWTTSQGLYPLLGLLDSGQYRPSTEAVFSRSGPKPDLRPRAGLFRPGSTGPQKERAGEGPERAILRDGGMAAGVEGKRINTNGRMR